MTPANAACLKFRGKSYAVRPDFALVREIERELGGIAALKRRFSRSDWEVSDLVTLVHMMLAAAGETVDYIALGNLMLKGGLKPYLDTAQSFFHLVLPGKEKP